VPLAALTGTLADETFDNDGLPYFVSTVQLDMVWSYENDALSLQFVALRGNGSQQINLGVYEPG
jgi:hypothetical protein